MFCEKCGKEIENGSKFCQYCGSEVENPNIAFEQQIPTQNQTQTPPTKKKSPLPIIIAIIAVVVILVIAAIVIVPKLLNRGGISTSNSDASSEAIYDEYDGYEVEYVSCDVSNYPNIKVYCRILDSNGNIVTLDNANFNIFEFNNSGEAIEKVVKNTMQLEGNEGLNISLIADKSYSMVDRMSDMQSVMSSFVHGLDYAAGDKVEFLSFDTFVMYMCTLTSDASLLENGIYNMVPEGDTALYDAIFEGLQSISLKGGAKCVICFTDGEDNQSRYTPADITAESQRLSIPVFIIGTDEADSGTLTSLAESCGGKYWNVGGISDISEVLNEIYGTQKEMYCIEYEADSSIDKLAARTIQICLGDNIICETEITPTQTAEEASSGAKYEVIQADISWQDANKEALKRGGHLVTITSQEEMDTVTNLVAQAGLKYVWMGGYTSVNNDVAFGHWITGEDFNQYTAWYEGEPSRNDLDGTPEMYLMLWYVGDAWSWNDQRNDPVNESGLDYFKGVSGYVIEY